MESPELSSGPTMFAEEFSFNLDSILKNMSEDDLYNAFLNEANAQAQQNSSPSSEPPVQLNTIEASEFPDLSSLDLTEYLLQPVKQEPSGYSPTVGRAFSGSKNAPIEMPEKRKLHSKDTSKSNKKPRMFKQEVKVETKVILPKREDKYQKRLQANKRSAQASRERKKALKIELEAKVEELVEENSQLGTSITELETENKVLKNEFVHLQRLISESSILSKLMARANMSLLPPEP